MQIYYPKSIQLPDLFATLFGWISNQRVQKYCIESSTNSPDLLTYSHSD